MEFRFGFASHAFQQFLYNKQPKPGGAFLPGFIGFVEQIKYLPRIR